MYKISEIENLEISNKGLDCTVSGKFFYRIASEGEGQNDFVDCYIADSSNDRAPKLFLANRYGESVIDMDETFGMMVGGEFAYFDINIVLSCVVKRFDEKLVCESLKSFTLERNGESQEFNFS